jgi:hypothetical protein
MSQMIARDIEGGSLALCRMKALHFLSLVVFYLLLSLSSCFAATESDQIKRAQTYLRDGDCVAAWNVLWPLAKSGSAEARYYLYGAVTFKLIPPGISGDSASWYRHLVTLGAYAAIAPKRQISAEFAPTEAFARTAMPAAIERLNLGERGARVAACYKRASRFDDCLRLGISLRVIPTFEQYAQETNDAAKATGSLPRCAPQRPNLE